MSKQRPPDPPPGQPRPQAPSPDRPPERKPKEPKVKSTSPWPWGRFRRASFSALIVMHLSAVFSAPWLLDLPAPFALPPRDARGATIPPDRVLPGQLIFERPVLVLALSRFFRHYCDLLYINSGYAYFSPDPVWSSLLDYEVYDKAGQKIASGRFPDRRDQWPRLLHRHMMLVDQMLSDEEEDSMVVGAAYKVADWLLEKHNGEAVRLTLVRHNLLRPQEVLAGKKLDDPSTYEVRRVMDHRRGDPTPQRRPPVRPPEQIAIPGAQP